jgi:cytoskeletal protein CcmA (bactofilin family)
MWRKEDGNPQAPEVSGSINSTAGKSGTPGSAPAVSGKASACVSQGIKIKGELTGSEDLFIDGIVDGKVTLSNSTLTIGPNATVKAEITAKELVVRGRAEGKFTASERVQIWHTARVEGDIKAERISIEEGAEMHGKLEAGKPVSVTSTGTTAQSKKADSNRPRESQAGDEKTTSGAASAGAD